MKPKVYIESSVISYLTARPSNDLVKAARQAITEAWWAENLQHFAVYVSELVEQEIAQGHPEAAARRLAVTSNIKNLILSEEAQAIAEQLVTAQAVPADSKEDALHIGIAAANGIDFLLTWNFKHINNASTKAAVRRGIEGWAINVQKFVHQKNLGIYYDQRSYCRRNQEVSCGTCGTLRQRLEENLRGTEKAGKDISKGVCSFRSEPVAIKARQQMIYLPDFAPADLAARYRELSVTTASHRTSSSFLTSILPFAAK